MILGVGTDIVSIARVAGFLERRGERAIRRVFSDREASYCLARGSSAASFAARFAAKEAFTKAMTTGIGARARWTEVEVVNLANGAPELRLHGAAAENARARGVRRVHLSLSHTDGLALAFVVLEG
jgi:holo-[acyl-carrier protein] synthase